MSDIYTMSLGYVMSIPRPSNEVCCVKSSLVLFIDISKKCRSNIYDDIER